MRKRDELVLVFCTYIVICAAVAFGCRVALGETASGPGGAGGACPHAVPDALQDATRGIA